MVNFVANGWSTPGAIEQPHGHDADSASSGPDGDRLTQDGDAACRSLASGRFPSRAQTSVGSGLTAAHPRDRAGIPN